MSHLRIAFISRKWPPAVGGMETYAKRLSDTLAETADVTRLVLPGRPDGQPPGALALLGFGIRSFVSILRHHRNTDILHIGDMASWPLALAAGKPAVVLAAHGTDVAYPLRGGIKGRLYAAYLRLGARLLPRALVIANSGATETAARRYGFTRTRVIALATDFRKTETPHSPTRLLFSGRLTPRKGLGWFTRTVLDRLPETLSLDVLGTVWDKEEAAALDHPRVRHLGARDQGDMAKAYAGALAVIIPNIPVPSREFEGFGLVAVEAAAAGGVVLASDDGGLSEAVIDGVTGKSLPAADEQAWISAITEIASWSPETRQTFTAQASRTAQEVFSWSRVARETLEAYQTLLDKDAR